MGIVLGSGRLAKQALISFCLLLLLNCGGGGKESGSSQLDQEFVDSPAGLTTPSALPTPVVNYVIGTYTNSDLLSNVCEAPREGQDAQGNAFPDKLGTRTDEKLFLRSWSNETYLWYAEIPDINPQGWAVPEYFSALKTSAKTATGQEKDTFHFSRETKSYQDFSQSGKEFGYGLTYKVYRDYSDVLRIRVITVEPDSPAMQAGINRGDFIYAVEGIRLDNLSTDEQIDKVISALYPVEPKLSHFTLSNRGVELMAEEVITTPVQSVKSFDSSKGKVGYMVFNNHIATAESQLVSAIEQLKADSIQELVLDLRYNGGGYLILASQLSYMIADQDLSDKAVFEELQFNDKHTNKQINPITGSRLQPMGFQPSSVGLSVNKGQPLPNLGLRRVFILSTNETCSASEAIINGLRGIDVDVVLIGDTTCGKPYGFYGRDNCGTTYFTIQFQGVNNKGFGAYPNGFSPSNDRYAVGVPVTGCKVSDDLDYALGDSNEPMVKAALNYIESGNCDGWLSSKGRKPNRFSGEMAQDESTPDPIIEAIKLKQPWKKNRIAF